MRIRKLLVLSCIFVLLSIIVLVGCDEVPAVDPSTCSHMFGEWEVAKAATCTEYGTKSRECALCTTIQSSGIAPTGHVGEDWTLLAPIGCETDGVETAPCIHCGEIAERVVEAPGHTITTVLAKEPTCKAPGWLEYEYCENCDYTTYVEQPILPNHSKVMHEGKAPTCTTPGWREYVTCEHCDYTTYQEIPAEHTAWRIVYGQASTCQNKGWEKYERCDDCGYALGYVELPLAAHSYDGAADSSCNVCGFERDVACTHQETQTMPGYAATCTAPGLTDGKQCADCQEIIETQTTIPATGHSEIPHAGKAPTCTEDGWDAYITCENCDYSTYEEKPTTGHDELPHAAQAPTCESLGWDAYVTCSRCDYTTYAPKPATGHAYDNDLDESCNSCGAIRDVTCEHPSTTTVPGYAASCTVPGLTDGEKCTACGETVTAQTPIPAPGHSETPHEAKVPTCTEDGWDAYVTCENCDYSTYKEKPATGHDELPHAAQAPTCVSFGWDAYVTCSRCDYTTYAPKPATGHSEIPHEAKAPTCATVGWDAYVTCENCDHTTYTEKGTVAHQYTSGKCEWCGISEYLYVREGNTVYFGSYPQTLLTNYDIRKTLNNLAGDLPTAANSGTWTSYGYYQSKEVEHYMWYQDIVCGGNTYRGVYFTAARPEWTIYNSSSYQSTNGYNANYVYWFKFEPISWTVLNQSGNVATLLCDMVLDAQAFQNEMHKGADNFWYTDSNGAPEGTFAGVYEYSTIRSWLNDTFLNTAFNELERALILVTSVDNSLASTGYAEEYDAKYCVGNNTQDKVFLLSRADALNIAYGYNASSTNYDTLRKKAPTDYAKSQGLYVSGGYGNWWMRSPMGRDNTGVHCSTSGTVSGLLHSLYSTSYGVVPVLRIELIYEECAHTSKTLHTTKSPTCTTVGAQYYTCDSCSLILDKEQLLALGHDLVQYAALPATCYASGWDAYEACGRSGCYYTTKQTVAAAHTVVDGVCTVCNNGKYISVGDSVTLGAYEQDNNTANGKEAIEWIVIATEGDKALVLSRYALEYMALEEKFADPFSNDYWWGNSYIRTFLSSEVYASFTEEEKQMILLSTLENKPYDNPYTSYEDETAKGPVRADTEDYVFLLSAQEFTMYGVSNRVETTACVNAKESAFKNASPEYNIWALRHRGWWYTALATESGCSTGDPAGTECLIRPAMWIDVSSLSAE